MILSPNEFNNIFHILKQAFSKAGRQKMIRSKPLAYANQHPAFSKCPGIDRFFFISLMIHLSYSKAI